MTRRSNCKGPGQYRTVRPWQSIDDFARTARVRSSASHSAVEKLCADPKRTVLATASEHTSPKVKFISTPGTDHGAGPKSLRLMFSWTPTVDAMMLEGGNTSIPLQDVLPTLFNLGFGPDRGRAGPFDGKPEAVNMKPTYRA